MSDQLPVSIQHVHRRFGKTPALDDVSFNVRAGEMFGLIGPDGAGKTTLLRVVAGLDRPTAGDVRLFGVDPFRVRGVAAHAIGYLAQRFSLYGDLSIDENVEFFARLHGVRDFRERRERLLSLTGLAPFRRRLADQLSGGMKQKLGLACTLVHEPRLLVLDEPTTGVDPVSRREFWKLLAEFLAGGLTIVLATPYLDEAERCHRVALLHGGRLLALEAPNVLRRSLPGVMVEVVAPDIRRTHDVVASIYGQGAVESFGDRLHLRLESGEAERLLSARLAEAGLSAVHVRPVIASLEDVFIDLLADSRRSQAAADAV
jgi:ABC-2 type transport system ATP-binding protein